MAGSRPNRTDVAVGQRIRSFRKSANVSQTVLAKQIGVTFQQVQKYENGTNRVGAGRLTQIAHALNIPIKAFFDGLVPVIDKRRANTERLAELSALPAAPKLLAAFSKIGDDVLQANLINFVRALGRRRGRRLH